MELDFDDTVLRELRDYVLRVTQALGLRGECSYVHADGQSEDGASAYIALDGRLANFPGQDVALLWDEHAGWSVAVETRSGVDLQVVARLDAAVMPPPAEVAVAVREVFGKDFTPVAAG
jgi:hypothetical protein